MSNSFGKNLRITTFGESHGPALGVVLDGLPAGWPISAQDIQADLDKRRPGQSEFTSARQEADKVEIVSGLCAAGKTNGAPLAMLVVNQDQRSDDYQTNLFRPGHADWPYFVKYGLPPQAGGGRASGRETVSRVAAGAIARKILASRSVRVEACALEVGGLAAQTINLDFARTHPLRFADPALAAKAEQAVLSAKDEGDSVGGVLQVQASNVPRGLGEPVFDKLQAILGQAFFSIGAVRGVEFGDARKICRMRGSKANDPLGPDGPLGNNHAGIMGGINTALPIIARLYVKPTPTIKVAQNTVDVDGRPAVVSYNGRHDPCLLPRLAPVAEAMMLLTLLDACMAQAARNFLKAE